MGTFTAAAAAGAPPAPPPICGTVGYQGWCWPGADVPASVYDGTVLLESASGPPGGRQEVPAIEAPLDAPTQLIVALADALRDPLEAAALLRLPAPMLRSARIAIVRRVTQVALPAIVARVTAHVHTAVLRRTALSLAHAVHARTLRKIARNRDRRTRVA